MGGHGHGHEPPYTVPKPDIYKVEEVPELMKLREELAEKGLKDPWLRNEVWRYKAFPGTNVSRAVRGLTRGFLVGIPAFLITIGVEQAFGISYAPSHDEDEAHGEHH
ncbi:NADH dehydrogenase [ubiquinone] 1 beta subcomplex subunit 3 [Ceratina calcarata]|uniref:NADH dehydrogenase [ubiquinone] 1 beta subcomplex subunit 3 n=1 Tax=Ceratina calcarata TaxID=156304 RepID=A0AAJ7S3D1_9HYME|nr:NADH dehydrogenase [ubiquinone] 1 beta subcomplex subunit 3 [Ceratina calcarata]XP_026670188.1 NADH dehydrogenase [ubiquinone] 1 beta subcomplex subunit 3 [Ceratina calcarata]